MAKKKFTDLQTFIILTMVCILSAGILAVVYNVTKDPIARAEAKEKEMALKIVLPGDMKSLKKEMLSYEGQNVEINVALDQNGNPIGYALESITPNGYGGDIVFLIGLDSEGRINTYKIMSHQETPGLGDNLRSGEFSKQFKGKNLENFVFKVAKDGGKVQAITAATISSRAACEALENGLKVFNAYKKGISNPSQKIDPNPGASE
jgi:electron transport complex protein RnfG